MTTTTGSATTVHGEFVEERSYETISARTIPSWGAIWAGLFAVLGIEIVLTLLMVGIFASFITPGLGTPPGNGYTIGIAVWFFLQTCGAYYIGGRVAGSFGRRDTSSRCGTQAVAVWGFATSLIVWTIVNASGASALATLEAIRFGIGMVSRGAAAIGPAAGGGPQAALGGVGALASAATPGIVAIATWIPIYLFIVFAASYVTAQIGARTAPASSTR